MQMFYIHVWIFQHASMDVLTCSFLACLLIDLLQPGIYTGGSFRGWRQSCFYQLSVPRHSAKTSLLRHLWALQILSAAHRRWPQILQSHITWKWKIVYAPHIRKHSSKDTLLLCATYHLLQHYKGMLNLLCVNCNELKLFMDFKSIIISLSFSL